MKQVALTLSVLHCTIVLQCIQRSALLFSNYKEPEISQNEARSKTGEHRVRFYNMKLVLLCNRRKASQLQ